MTDRRAVQDMLQMAAAVTPLGIVVGATVAMIGAPPPIAADVVLGGQVGTGGFNPHTVRGAVRAEVPQTDDAHHGRLPVPATDGTWHARNLFPVGGVVEDPATGAAAAAVGAYLRSSEAIATLGRFDIVQGEETGRTSQLHMTVPAGNRGVGVSGTALDIPPSTERKAGHCGGSRRLPHARQWHRRGAPHRNPTRTHTRHPCGVQ